MKLTKTLKAMKNNKRDWTMEQITHTAKKLGISYTNNGSSHYVFQHANSIKNLSIPNHHDIHPQYINRLLKFIEQVK